MIDNRCKRVFFAVAKKILFINNRMMFYRPDGFFYVSKKAGELLTQLLERGNEVYFLQSYQKVDFNEEQFSDYKLLPHDRLNIIGVKRNRSRIFIYAHLYYKGFIALLKSDFLYIFYPDRLFLLCFIAIFLRKKIGIYIRGSIGIYNRISKMIYKRVGLCCTVSPEITEFVNNLNKNFPARTITPLIDFQYRDIKREFKTKEIYNILFVGRVVQDKGLIELIMGLFELRSSISVTLHILGDGDAMHNMVNLVRKLNLQESVCFHGHINELSVIQKYYEKMDALCLPSYHEGFPRVLYEAMIFRLPIITTFVGTISYLMKDKYNCREIEVKSSSSICNVLNSFFTDYTRQASYLTANASETVKNYLAQNSKSQIDLICDYLNEI